MDYKEAIELLHPETSRNAIWKIADEENAIKEIEEALVMACEAMQELQEYRKLGTLEEVREAVERQQAKKPVVGADVMVGRDDDGNPIWENDYECAECGMGIEPEYVCCPYCETVIDWSEEI